MMQSDTEMQVSRLERQVEAKKRQGKKYLLAIIILTFLATGLLASTIALGVIHARHVQRCNIMSPADLLNNPYTPHAPQGPAIAPSSKGPIAAPAVAARHSPPPYYPATNGTNGTSPSSPSPKDAETCEPGKVYGGQQLDDLNHEYMPLMQKALSLSPAAQAGEVRDYYHTSLGSVFRCGGESMEPGALELVAACKARYVVDGEKVECDADGSYGGSDLASDSASA